MDFRKLVEGNVRVLRLCSGQQAIGIKDTANKGYTKVLLMEGYPVKETVEVPGQTNEDGTPMVVDVVNKYRISMLPFYYIPGSIDESRKPHVELRDEHVMFEAVPSESVLDGYFATLEAHSAPSKQPDKE